MTTRSRETKVAVSAAAGEDDFALISNDKLFQLYAAMLKCRLLDERLRARANGSPRGATLAATGHEAATVGAAFDLLPEDTFISAHCDLLPCLLQGVPLETLLATAWELSAHRPQSDSLKLATHAAIAHKRSKTGRVAVAILPTASAPVNRPQKTLSFAGVQNLPLVVVSWRKSIPMQPKTRDFPAITVDGNDAVAVYRVASEAIAHARKGSGPTLIESVGWKVSDPILNMEHYLTRKGLPTRSFTTRLAARFNRELDAAFERTLKFVASA
jgi:TPP-dependent pyruvate/acetoin dehydrogenase alpha subunit